MDAVRWEREKDYMNDKTVKDIDSLIEQGLNAEKSELDLREKELDDEDLSLYPIEEYPHGDDLPHPEQYSIIVRLPADDRFFSSRLQRVGQEFGEQMGVEGGL